MPAIKNPDKHKFTNLKLSCKAHLAAKSAAAQMSEGFYQFVETAIWERIERLTKAKLIGF